MTPLEKAARAVCDCKLYNGGQGTCAAICMEQLGDARSGPHGCRHAINVHGPAVRAIIAAIRDADDDPQWQAMIDKILEG